LISCDTLDTIHLQGILFVGMQCTTSVKIDGKEEKKNQTNKQKYPFDGIQLGTENKENPKLGTCI
jgi:hypothetical protein